MCKNWKISPNSVRRRAFSCRAFASHLKQFRVDGWNQLRIVLSPRPSRIRTGSPVNRTRQKRPGRRLDRIRAERRFAPGRRDPFPARGLSAADLRRDLILQTGGDSEGGGEDGSSRALRRAVTRQEQRGIVRRRDPVTRSIVTIAPRPFDDPAQKEKRRRSDWKTLGH